MADRYKEEPERERSLQEETGEEIEIPIQGVSESEEEKQKVSSAEEQAEDSSGESREGASKEGEEAIEEASQEDSSPEEEPDEEAEESTEEGTEEEEPGKTSFFGRRKKDKEKEKLKEQVEELTDRLKRSMAEFDNFRKRTEREKASMYVIGARDIVEKMLPVLDSFERGLKNAPEGDPFAEGMVMIHKQMATALEELGVMPIEAVGKEFDPSLHNAVMHVEDESLGENIVVEEFQKGYTYKDFVVRHSMVKVAN